jgi:hypothetical protein
MTSFKSGNAEIRATRMLLNALIFLIVLRGLRILRVLKADKLILELVRKTGTHEVTTIRISIMFHRSLIYASLFRINPIAKIFKNISIV